MKGGRSLPNFHHLHYLPRKFPHSGREQSDQLTGEGRGPITGPRVITLVGIRCRPKSGEEEEEEFEDEAVVGVDGAAGPSVPGVTGAPFTVGRPSPPRAATKREMEVRRGIPGRDWFPSSV
ncbi:hypothetical protein TYRP_009548 [Tyrophagus putrescentiae]|nr:hypothetical protein TYRP_009548 [Tyrophagus putrescentiae]